MRSESAYGDLAWRYVLKFVAACIVPTVLAAPGALAKDAQAILAVSDAIRNPEQPFRALVTLTEFEKGVQVNTTALVSFARTVDNSGQFASIMQFVRPPRDAGKVMLKNGSDLWFFDPGTKSTVRVAPQQRLIGQAANGDVVTVNLARDYQAALAGEETVRDGERQNRQALKLLLTAKGPDSTYGSIEWWVDADTHAPIKGRFFADSGRLLKTAFYRRFQQQLGALRPTETVIIDGVEPQAVTIVRMSELSQRSVPASWFQRDHLPRFNPD